MNSIYNKYSFILLWFIIINSSCEGFMGRDEKLDRLVTVDYVDLEKFIIKRPMPSGECSFFGRLSLHF